MKRIYLIRHGLPDFPNGQRQCIGSTDLPLSEEGVLQASEMARALPTVSAVFSSPLTRAMETARARDLSLQPPGAESREAGLARFSAAMEEAARRSPGDLAVVAHGGIIALFLEHITGRWHKPDYCEIITLQWDESGIFQQEESSCGKC